MNERRPQTNAASEDDGVDNRGNSQNTISPLPGEHGIPSVAARPGSTLSKKGLLAVGLLIISLVAASALSIQRITFSDKKPGDGEPKLASDRPAAATTDPRRLELPMAPTQRTSTIASPQIPALIPTSEELVEPIGVRRSGQAPAGAGAAKNVSPEDAPVLLVSSRPVNRGHSGATAPSSPTKPSEQGLEADPTDPADATTRDLQAYQRQLQGLLDTLTKSTAMATGQLAGPATGHPSVATMSLGTPAGAGHASNAPAAISGALLGGQLQGSSTPRVAASVLGNRSLTLPKGTAFNCALKTKVISANSGLVGCQVQRNVFGDDGRVLLIERGSHMDGEYRISSVRPGTVRIPVLWTRIRTPLGVTVDIGSPGTGQLGESGIDGHVDNRWGERIGAAMLLSLIDDSVRLVIQGQANDTQANTVVLPSTTANTSKLAEKVLDSTINIPPLIYQNQGGIVGIYVARDVDFSSVYELQAVAR